MIAKLRIIAPLVMAGAVATGFAAAPVALAETYAAAAQTQITPLSQGPRYGGCTDDGTCGQGGPDGGGGCTANGVCGHGGPSGGGGCVPGVGCFEWNP
ncbi:hypothetical protein [Mycobacterium sp. IS-1556]|uniref:hypothetical protein n=1 Tax=Mycobacterium sp. IS-1556 TaxID=1772276 RepID=UPI0007418336|nr:hypothetical protein [Mycobacterium sp. IS-1556]KUH84745.1 hypothetical protein AU187_19700 [Mycobacterium sp. IS-1556]